MKKIIYWLPRVLTILFICFNIILALDVFQEGYTFWQLISGFFIHSIPGLTILVFMFIAWKNEKIGGIIFLILGLVSIFIFKAYKTLEILLWLIFPMFLIGSLFLLSYKYSKKNIA